MNKKTVRSNSNSAITNLLTQGAQESDYLPVFYDQVANIMRGFGDAEGKYQIKESVIMVEKIVNAQLKGILQETIDHAFEATGKLQPRPKDFEFLMRRNPVKILRLRKYLKDLQFFKKRVRDMLGSRYQNMDDDNLFEQSDEESDLEWSEKFDEEKTRRIFRADRISQILSAGSQYQEYNEARRTSFLGRNANLLKTRMREWLKVPAEVVLVPKVLTILAFLAHETIGTIVDYCILSRLNSSNRKQVEPYDRVTSSGTSFTMLHLCPEVTQGRGADGVKPITVQEIKEALRRHSLMASRKMGMHRSVAVLDQTSPFLAL
ncbi:transcription initiation protein SPT3 homolog [Culicoides brevitarsis]|uniref:transcription initiation protein SPT3 homolog n=1 Tax=Culicoides brevitarsis TaxID=469753 RepID=UPI00307CA879